MSVSILDYGLTIPDDIEPDCIIKDEAAPAFITRQFNGKRFIRRCGGEPNRRLKQQAMNNDPCR